MTIKQRVTRLDWQAIEAALWEQGYVKTAPLLTQDECTRLVALYPRDRRFRSRVDMARYRFGVGEYKYFADPLPLIVQQLRVHLYPHLAAIANRWMAALGQADRFPATFSAFAEYCHANRQVKPTPLMLSYTTDGYNCLHQDLYGQIVFPLQLTCFLSQREVDYTGGEFLLVEQRPRAQSRGVAITTEQGEMLIFPTQSRPVAGKRGHYRAIMRHGVSRILSGSRYTLGIIFHNAK